MIRSSIIVLCMGLQYPERALNPGAQTVRPWAGEPFARQLPLTGRLSWLHPGPNSSYFSLRKHSALCLLTSLLSGAAGPQRH